MEAREASVSSQDRPACEKQKLVKKAPCSNEAVTHAHGALEFERVHLQLSSRPPNLKGQPPAAPLPDQQWTLLAASVRKLGLANDD